MLENMQEKKYKKLKAWFKRTFLQAMKLLSIMSLKGKLSREQEMNVLLVCVISGILFMRICSGKALLGNMLEVRISNVIIMWF